MAEIDDVAMESNNIIEGLIEQADGDIDAAINEYEALIIEFVSSDDIEDVTLTDTRLQEILVASGFLVAVSEIVNRIYQETLDTSVNMYTSLYDRPFVLADTSIDALNVVRAKDASKLASFASDINDNLSRQVASMLSGDATRAQILRALRETINTEFRRHIKTWVNTQTSAYYRTVTVRLALDNGIKRFKYIGPVDSLMRPFCREHIGQIRTIDEWNALDNGQIRPVSAYQGGYNCRHDLVGV